MLIDQICCWLFENEDDDDDYDDNDYEDNATNIDEEKEEDEEEKEDGEYNEIGADADEDVGFNGEKQSKFNSEKLVSFEEEEEEEKGGTKPLAHNSDDNCRNNFNSVCTLICLKHKSQNCSNGKYILIYYLLFPLVCKHSILNFTARVPLSKKFCIS